MRVVYAASRDLKTLSVIPPFSFQFEKSLWAKSEKHVNGWRKFGARPVHTKCTQITPSIKALRVDIDRQPQLAFELELPRPFGQRLLQWCGLIRLHQ